MATPHECRQEQEILSMSRQLKALFGLFTIVLVIMGWVLIGSNRAAERAQAVEVSVAATRQDVGWIKETLVEIKSEVKKKP